MARYRYIVGVDEAGRGPLAGPVAVGVVMTPADFDWSLVENVRESKKLSEKMREKIYESARELESRAFLRFAVSTSSAAYIDKYGIVSAIRRALAEALARLEVAPNECRILLDGSLRAPAEYIHQETIIRGDESEPVISLASIMAKVTRDRLMKRLSPKYPAFNFETHKGYGTALHMSAIARYGLSDMHRATFCSRLHIGPRSV